MSQPAQYLCSRLIAFLPHNSNHGRPLRRVCPSSTSSVLFTNAVHRFGNFIGEAEESDDEAQDGAPAGDAYLDDDEADEVAENNDQQLMQLDGRLVQYMKRRKLI